MEFIKNYLIKNSYQIILLFFSILICHYTGNKGVFPIDSFAHYDSGFRILNGEQPFRDFWVVSGPFIDYLQSLLFYLFGTNWQIYILGASLINATLTVATYYLLLNLGLEKKFSFFYSISFAVLAYPSSGTPFVDHHSSFLSLLAIYFLIFAMQRENKYFWFLIPYLMIISFLSKQVPAAYILILIIGVLAYHTFFLDIGKIIKIFFTLAISSITALILFIFFLKFNEIKFENFYTQYILYPSSLGKERYANFNYDFKNIFLDFKFVYLILVFTCGLILREFRTKKNFHKHIYFKTFLIFIFLFFILAHHIILTKNQIFIFFLIPLFAGFAHVLISHQSYKLKNYFSLILIVFCVGLTIKYHYRYNIERKFHELNKTDFNKAISGKIIDENLWGLRWITPKITSFKQNEKSIATINYFKMILSNDKNNKIVITNYSLFSVLLDENISAFTRWFPGDNSAFPKIENDFFNEYKKFINNFLKTKNIKSIYIFPDVKENHLLDYVNVKCLLREELQFQIIKYDLKTKCDNV